mgnify:CR=1 FL=1
MASPKKPYYECEVCGYQDWMANTLRCPLCDPEPDEKDELCFFLNAVEETCRQDGEHCPYAQARNWADCPKLTGEHLPFG